MDMASLRSLRFSPDGKVLAMVEPFRESVVLLEMSTGRTLAKLRIRGDANSRDIAFSPDGRTLASTGYALKI
jgi:hypothetical protein